MVSMRVPVRASSRARPMWVGATVSRVVDGVGVDEPDAGDLAPGDQRRGQAELLTQALPAGGGGRAHPAGRWRCRRCPPRRRRRRRWRRRRRRWRMSSRRSSARATVAPSVAGRCCICGSGRRMACVAGGVASGPVRTGMPRVILAVTVTLVRSRSMNASARAWSRVRSGSFAGVGVGQVAHRGPGGGGLRGGDAGPPVGGAVRAGADLHGPVALVPRGGGGDLLGGDAGGDPAGDGGDPGGVHPDQPVDQGRLHRGARRVGQGPRRRRSPWPR